MFRLPFNLGAVFSFRNFGSAAALAALAMAASAENDTNAKTFRNHGHGGRRTLYTYWGGARRITHTGRPAYNRTRENARNLRNMQEAAFRRELRAQMKAIAARGLSTVQVGGVFSVSGPDGRILDSIDIAHAAA